MTRRTFGGGPADQLLKRDTDGDLQVETVGVPLYTQPNLAAQTFDLLDLMDAPFPGGVVPPTEGGYLPEFLGPDDGTRRLYALATDSWVRLDAKDGVPELDGDGTIPDAVIPATVARVADVDADLAGRVGRGELVLNVRDYGAEGDGVADDTAAIQAAIAAAAADGALLLIPEGIYRLAASIKLKAGVRIRGAGWRTVLQPATGAVSAIEALAADTVTDAAVEDLKVLGAGGTAGADGIKLDGATRVTLRRVWVDAAPLAGVLVTNSTRCRIVACRVTGANGGIQPGTQTPSIDIKTGGLHTVRDCEISGGAWVGVSLYDSSDNLVTGCDIWGNGHSGVNVYRASHRNQVLANRVHDQLGGNGIVVDGSGFGPATHNLVANNTIVSVPVAGVSVQDATHASVQANVIRASQQNAGIHVLVAVGTVADVSIEGNVVEGVTGHGVYINATEAAPVRRAQIVGNKVRAATLSGLNLLGLVQSMVSGNHASGCGQHGVVTGSGANKVHRSVIAGNTASDNGTSTTNTYSGITVDGDRNTLTGNVAASTAATGQKYGIRINTGTSNAVVGNVCTGNLTTNLLDSGTTTTVSANITT